MKDIIIHICWGVYCNQKTMSLRKTWKTESDKSNNTWCFHLAKQKRFVELSKSREGFSACWIFHVVKMSLLQHLSVLAVSKPGILIWWSSGVSLARDGFFVVFYRMEKVGVKTLFSSTIQKQASTHESVTDRFMKIHLQSRLSRLRQVGLVKPRKLPGDGEKQPFHPSTLLVVVIYVVFRTPHLRTHFGAASNGGLSEPNDEVRGLVENLLTKSSVVALNKLASQVITGFDSKTWQSTCKCNCYT